MWGRYKERIQIYVSRDRRCSGVANLFVVHQRRRSSLSAFTVGLGGRARGASLLKRDPDAISTALAELQGEGLVELTRRINLEVPRVRKTLALFTACDAAITGHNPIEDSVILARMLLADHDFGGNARDLEAAAGWTRRRFNPAFALIVPCIGEGRVRNAYQPDYPVLGVLVGDDDVSTLQRYIREHVR